MLAKKQLSVFDMLGLPYSGFKGSMQTVLRIQTPTSAATVFVLRLSWAWVVYLPLFPDPLSCHERKLADGQFPVDIGSMHKSAVLFDAITTQLTCFFVKVFPNLVTIIFDCLEICIQINVSLLQYPFKVSLPDKDLSFCWGLFVFRTYFG